MVKTHAQRWIEPLQPTLEGGGLPRALVKNPAHSDCISRDSIKGGEIGILTARETRVLLYGIDEKLMPALALWCFSGARMAEIARLTVSEVRQGLKTGFIYLEAAKTKTGSARSLPISANLRVWLERYLPPTGPVLPLQWQTLTGLSELSRYLERKTGVTWKKNAPRHSFATYSLVLTKDAPALVKEMGTSLQKLEAHYWSRATSVTLEEAAEYFGIVPADRDKVLTIPSQPSAAVV